MTQPISHPSSTSYHLIDISLARPFPGVENAHHLDADRLNPEQKKVPLVPGVKNAHHLDARLNANTHFINDLPSNQPFQVSTQNRHLRSKQHRHMPCSPL
jgi:hypothetical protein